MSKRKGVSDPGSATAIMEDAVMDDAEEGEMNAIEPQTPKVVAYEEHIEGELSRGAVEFIVFGGEGNCLERSKAVLAEGFQDLMNMHYFARLLVEVKRLISPDHLFQPLASAIELLQLNQQAEDPPTTNVVWAVLTDLDSWWFIRVELQDEKFYISRGPNLRAPLLSTKDQTLSNGGGLMRVIAALHEIMYSVPLGTKGVELQSSSSELSRMTDTWVTRLIGPLKKEWTSRQKDEQLKLLKEQLEQQGQQLEQKDKQLEQKDKQLEKLKRQLMEVQEQLGQKDKQMEKEK
ncbi:hypothetical protein GPECTOR_219g468 [Gonium pectorale]|uniref:Uncharacterized protein n=1 Tax=Gonium pectorale TaxID=33097 RepID=A0A150FWP2_GONPE|nr:hypothetical protein GPECTOR_219g468 [Gonium pectorale]|eukprot:KXZ42032.1 hypothetical protein GPECTOR_219g468 [Gonium pectorale]